MTAWVPLIVNPGISQIQELASGQDLNLTGSNIANAVSITSTNLTVTGTTSLTGTVTAPTATVGTNTTQVATTAFVISNGVPSGVITMWSGSIVSIPSGWYLCDGSNSTPDLRNRFIVGAGSTYSVAGTGGTADAVVVSHTHTASSVVSDSGHSHTYTRYSSINVQSGSSSPCWIGTTTDNTGVSTTGITVATTNSSTGVSGTNQNLPPYYALAYIMKG